MAYVTPAALVVMWCIVAVTTAKMFKYKGMIDEGFSHQHHAEIHRSIEQMTHALQIVTLLIEKHDEEGNKLHCSECNIELEVGPNMTSSIAVGVDVDSGRKSLYCARCAPISEAPDTVPEDWFEG